MKLINQSAEIWKQSEGEVGIYKQVEKAARLCYKSEDKTTEDSYKKFIGMLNDKGHNSPFEHGTVYLTLKGDSDEFNKIAEGYQSNPYSKVTTQGYDWFITTNYRVIKEHGWEEDLKYLCEPTEYHEKRISIHVITSIGISREFNRHRCHSICEESTRYCNYSKDKFGNEVTFIKPTWLSMADTDEGREVTRDWVFDILDGCAIIAEENEFDDARDAFLTSLNVSEHCYFELLAKGWKPQQARDVLPLATKTELIHTAFESDWEEFFKLRCSPAAHPMMQELANQIKELIHKK